MNGIFDLFKESIEKVNVKNTDRSAINKPNPTVYVALDAIVKRRKNMIISTANSEDYNSNITVHFRMSDAQYIKIGHYVEIDNEWHTILEVKDGKDFDNGSIDFIYVTLDNDIVPEEDEPIWQQTLSV